MCGVGCVCGGKGGTRIDGGKEVDCARGCRENRIHFPSEAEAEWSDQEDFGEQYGADTLLKHSFSMSYKSAQLSVKER